MIQLSSNEERVYTLLKKKLTQDQIQRLTGGDRKTIIRNLHILVEKGLATVTYSGRIPTFTAVYEDYELINRRKKVAQ